MQFKELFDEHPQLFVNPTGIGKVIRKPQLVPQASVKTGTDHASAEPAEYATGLDEPAVFRNPRSEASARISAMAQKGVERLDIPAFLRRQAD